MSWLCASQLRLSLISFVKDYPLTCTHRSCLDGIMKVCLGRTRYTKYIGLPTVNILRFAFSPTFYPSHSANLILSDLDNVRRERTKARLLARPRDELWVTYSCNAFIKQSVVKSWNQRRLKRAVLESLREKGYDRLGRRVGTNGVVEQGKNLKGTLEISGFNNMALAEWKEVRRQIGLVVEKVVTMCSPKAEQATPAHTPKGNKKEGLQGNSRLAKSVKNRKQPKLVN